MAKNFIRTISITGWINKIALLQKHFVVYLTNFAGKIKHILDLVIECVENTIAKSVNVEPQNTISDPMVVHFKIFVDDIPKKQDRDQLPQL